MMTTFSPSLNAFALTARKGRTREPLGILGAEVSGRLGALHFGANRAENYSEEHPVDILLLPYSMLRSVLAE